MRGNVIVPYLILPRSRSKHRSGETILRLQGRVDNLLKVMFWRLINTVFVFVTTLFQRSRDCLNFLYITKKPKGLHILGHLNIN